MKIYIYKTNITSQQKVVQLSTILQQVPGISRWTIDMEDIDKVLRVEANDSVYEDQLMWQITAAGCFCEQLNS